MGAALHHARWCELTQDDQDAAVTELRELAAGRAGLLARQATQLCRLSGADET
jgi:hypothetical protein